MSIKETICIILLTIIAITILFLLSCASMLQNKGTVMYIKNEEINTNEKSHFINYNSIDSAFRNIQNWFKAKGKDTEGTTSKTTRKGGEPNMDGINELLTVLGSAIAGVYCAIKAVWAFIKKFKK